jgi:RNA polymerase sigma factor (sigma-70 family)
LAPGIVLGMNVSDESSGTGTSSAPPVSRQAAPRLSPEILAGVCRREPRSLALLFRAYFPEVYSLAYRLLGDRHLAEDITQEVFLKVHRSAHGYDPGRDPGPWLTTITYNACRDLWRSRAYKLRMRSRSVDEEEQGVVPLPDPGPDPERAMIRGEDEARVQAAILSLPEEQRAIVLLHDYKGMNHEEISRLIGVSHAAVRKRYSRALKTLADHLGGGKA